MTVLRRALHARFVVIAGAGLALWLLAMSNAAADQEWREVKRDADNDVVIYQRELPSGHTEFKGITHVRSTLSGCVALIRDVDAMPEWVYRTEKARVLDWISDKEVIAYNVSAPGWPLENRYAIIHTVLDQDAASGTVTIRGQGIEEYPGPTRFDYRADAAGYVRMPQVESTWRFSPQGNGRIEVTFQGFGDPGGNVAEPPLSWLVGMMVWEAPYETLIGLRAIIGQERYQRARFEFIREVGRRDGDS